MEQPSVLSEIPPEKWDKALPTELPEPTYWPFFLAIGLGFIFWGLLTTWLMLSVGFLIAFIAIARWIKLLDHERE